MIDIEQISAKAFEQAYLFTRHSHLRTYPQVGGYDLRNDGTSDKAATKLLSSVETMAEIFFTFLISEKGSYTLRVMAVEQEVQSYIQWMQANAIYKEKSHDHISTYHLERNFSPQHVSERLKQSVEMMSRMLEPSLSFKQRLSAKRSTP